MCYSSTRDEPRGIIHVRFDGQCRPAPPIHLELVTFLAPASSGEWKRRGRGAKVQYFIVPCRMPNRSHSRRGHRKGVCVCVCVNEMHDFASSFNPPPNASTPIPTLTPPPPINNFSRLVWKRRPKSRRFGDWSVDGTAW